MEDFAVSNILLPVGSLVYLLFCVSRVGWGFKIIRAKRTQGQAQKSKLDQRLCHFRTAGNHRGDPDLRTDLILIQITAGFRPFRRNRTQKHYSKGREKFSFSLRKIIFRKKKNRLSASASIGLSQSYIIQSSCKSRREHTERSLRSFGMLPPFLCGVSQIFSSPDPASLSESAASSHSRGRFLRGLPPLFSCFSGQRIAVFFPGFSGRSICGQNFSDAPFFFFRNFPASFAPA